jgi:hypothetical protein
MPADWQMAIIFLIYKKGDKLNCINHRGILLLNVVYKIFTNTLARYLEVYTEEILGDYQYGFRKERSTTDQIFILRQIIEETYKLSVDIHQLFNDYKQAYDNINRQQMYKIMKEFGTPEESLTLFE